MNEHEMVALLEKEVRGLSSVLTIEDYQNACDDAVRETGWALSSTNSNIIYWLKQRAKRHLFFYLMSESAHKFKVKQYSLNQRFDHYRDTIEYMDKLWAEFLATNELILEDSVGLFGTKINAGFQYDSLGRDTTYDDDNVVIFEPNENSE
jgi:hypothetical protein